jgi:hypothetical protein
MEIQFTLHFATHNVGDVIIGSWCIQCLASPFPEAMMWSVFLLPSCFLIDDFTFSLGLVDVIPLVSSSDPFEFIMASCASATRVMSLGSILVSPCE